MFALESLSLNGETYTNSASVKKACEFLRSKQKLDGGWGETYMVSSSVGLLGLCIRARNAHDWVFAELCDGRIFRTRGVAGRPDRMGRHVAGVCWIYRASAH